MTTIHCPRHGTTGLSAEDAALVYLAGSQRHQASLHCTVLEFQPGWYALYAPGQSFPEILSDSWAELEEAYRTRPAYRPHFGAPSTIPPSQAKSIRGVDLGGLNISI